MEPISQAWQHVARNPQIRVPQGANRILPLHLVRREEIVQDDRVVQAVQGDARADLRRIHVPGRSLRPVSAVDDHVVCLCLARRVEVVRRDGRVQPEERRRGRRGRAEDEARRLLDGVAPARRHCLHLGIVRGVEVVSEGCAVGPEEGHGIGGV